MGDDLTRVVHVRGDNDAIYGEVVKVMDKLASNGITHIAIMTNSRKQVEAPPRRGRTQRHLARPLPRPFPPLRRRSLRRPSRRPPWPPRRLEGGENDAGRDSSELTGGSSSGAPNFPPVKPRWLGPATTLMVVLAHVGVAAFLMTTAIEKITPLESINMDLVPEGDMFESEQVEATDEVVPPEEMEQPDLAIPLPEVMTPDAPPIPVKKKEVVEPKRRVVEHKEVAQAKEHREAQDRHRIGMAGGRGTGSLSQAGYKALLAARSAATCEHLVARRGVGVVQLPCVLRRRHDGHLLLGFVGRSCIFAAQRYRRDSRAAAAWRRVLRGAKRPLPLNDREQGFFRSLE